MGVLKHPVMRTLLAAAIAVVGYFIFTVPVFEPQIDPPAVVEQAEPAYVPGIKLSGYLEGIDSQVNAVRAAKGLPALKMDQRLDDSARLKAEDMAAKDYWSHNAPDGTEPWKFIQGTGIPYRRAGENLAKCYSSSADAVAAWVASPSHYENIIGDYDYFGFGTAAYSDGCVIIVNHFVKAQ